jgi:lipopolysaccharide export system protein LptA
VADNQLKQPVPYSLRIKVPILFRIGAVVAILVAIGVVVAGFLRERGRASFKLKSEHTRLSEDVLSEVDGYERLETEEGSSLYLIRADHAKTFTDNHLELRGVYVELYREGGAADTMKSAEAIYVPEESKNFTAYLNKDVEIRTVDGLSVQTEGIVYTRATDTAEIESNVAFSRGTVRGKSVGAVAKLGAKHLSLLREVDIETFESPELAKSNVRYARLQAGSATFDQAAGKIDLNSGITIDIQSKARNGSATASRSLVLFHEGAAGDNRLKQFELFENAKITSNEGANSVAIEAAYALYDKDADRYELKDSVKIKSVSGGREFQASSSHAVLEQSAHKLALTGSAEIVRGGDTLRGESLFANLFPDNDVKDAVVRGNASLNSSSEGRAFRLNAPQLNAAFNDARVMTNANAVGASAIEFLPAVNSGYTKVTGNAARGMGITFRGDGPIEHLITDGRTTIQMNVPPGAGAANKRVTADSVKTYFAANGKDIQRAEAVGDAELYIEPLAADRKNFKTTITSDRFACAFFATGNNARECEASPKSKAVRIPTVAVAGKGTQTISGGILTARFGEKSSDIESLDLRSGAKFNELDRNAVADTIAYAASDEVIRLRGGEPVVWDSRGRAKAKEIDLDTRKNRSSLRGGVSTTYYSQKQIKGATPFGASEKPVFITAASADFDHDGEIAVYSGNARGWQDDNYVRGDKLTINQAAGTFFAEGNVQSLIYNAKRREKGKESTGPASASAGSLAFERDNRILRYKTGVDIRQGTDRITAGSADIYLAENNDVSRTVAQNNVVISQPSRRAAGDWAQYSAADEVAILKGSPATITDSENGSSQAGEVTFSLRDNRVTAVGKTPQNGSTRMRSVYKIKDFKP